MMVVQLTGHLGQDPRLKQLDSGAILNLSVACKDRIKRDGQWTEITVWWDCTVFGPRAAGLAQILGKGSRVGIVGKFGQRQYTAKDGALKTVNEVVAWDVEPLESKAEKEARMGVKPPVSPYSAEPAYSRPMPQHRDGLAPQGSYGAPPGPPQGQWFDDGDDIPF